VDAVLIPRKSEQKSDVIVPVLFDPSPVNVAPAYSGINVTVAAGRAAAAKIVVLPSASNVIEFVPSVREKADSVVSIVNVSVASVIANTCPEVIVIVGVAALHVQSPSDANVLIPDTAPPLVTVKPVLATENVSNESPIVIVSASALLANCKVSQAAELHTLTAVAVVFPIPKDAALDWSTLAPSTDPVVWIVPLPASYEAAVTFPEASTSKFV
jgi:hypothetical protein